MFARTPTPPYYAVIFTSTLSGEDPQGYAEAAQRMVDLAQTQPGFLGIESVRGTDGLGLTVSYWTSEAAIRHWRDNAEHAAARANGRSKWYGAMTTRVAKVERAYGFIKQEG
jgi:heme-degrading monooxygenase HmoA